MDIICDSNCPSDFYGTEILKGDSVFDYYNCSIECGADLFYNDVTMKCVTKCESSVSIGDVFVDSERCVDKCGYYEIYTGDTHSV